MASARMRQAVTRTSVHLSHYHAVHDSSGSHTREQSGRGPAVCPNHSGPRRGASLARPLSAARFSRAVACLIALACIFC